MICILEGLQLLTFIWFRFLGCFFPSSIKNRWSFLLPAVQNIRKKCWRYFKHFNFVSSSKCFFCLIAVTCINRHFWLKCLFIWPQNWTPHPRCGLTSTAGSTFPDAAQDTSSLLSSKGGVLAHTQLGVYQDSQVLFGQAASQLGAPARASAWGCASPGAGLGSSPCCSSWGCGLPISPSCPGPSGWLHNPLVYQPLLTVLSHPHVLLCIICIV